MNSNLITLLILNILYLHSAFARGGLDAGGGDGVLIEAKPYLLDLVEAGVHKNPYFESGTASPAILATLDRTVTLPGEKKSEILTLLAEKLTEIDKGAHPLGLIYAEAFRFYRLVMTNFELIDIPDDDSVLGIDKIQLAIRKGSVIYLNQKYWDLLDSKNKVALLLHELTYSFQPGFSVGWPETLKSSSKARFLNALFFQENWQKDWLGVMSRELMHNGYSLNYLFTAGSRYGNHRGVKVVRLNSELPSASSFRFDSISIRHRKSTNSTDIVNVGKVGKASSPVEIASVCKRAVPPKNSSPYTKKASIVYSPSIEIRNGRLILVTAEPENPTLSPEKDGGLPEVFYDFQDSFDENSFPTNAKECIALLENLIKEFLD